MSVRDYLLISMVVESGPDDRVFDSLLLAGPPIIALIAVLGRTPLTTGVAATYIGVFLTYTLYQGIKHASSQS